MVGSSRTGRRGALSKFLSRFSRSTPPAGVPSPGSYRLASAGRDRRLGTRDEAAVLPVEGTVTWREDDTVGIAFNPGTSGDATAIYRALRRFLDGRR